MEKSSYWNIELVISEKLQIFLIIQKLTLDFDVFIWKNWFLLLSWTPILIAFLDLSVSTIIKMSSKIYWGNQFESRLDQNVIKKSIQWGSKLELSFDILSIRKFYSMDAKIIFGFIALIQVSKTLCKKYIKSWGGSKIIMRYRVFYLKYEIRYLFVVKPNVHHLENISAELIPI